MTETNKGEVKEYDIYRDSLLRYLGKLLDYSGFLRSDKKMMQFFHIPT